MATASGEPANTYHPSPENGNLVDKRMREGRGKREEGRGKREEKKERGTRFWKMAILLTKKGRGNRQQWTEDSKKTWKMTILLTKNPD